MIYYIPKIYVSCHRSHFLTNKLSVAFVVKFIISRAFITQILKILFMNLFSNCCMMIMFLKIILNT